MVNARAKGAAGEREFCDYLEKHFDLPEQAKRNLEQVRSGGTDIIMPPFAFEIKRQERLSLENWWIQAKKDGKDLGLEPVVAFRQNRQPWEFLISAKFIIDSNLGFIRISAFVFKKWAEDVWNKPV